MNKDEDASQTFQDLISSIGTVQTMICHHMHKEEEQVFFDIDQDIFSLLVAYCLDAF